MPYHKILEGQISRLLPKEHLQDEAICNFLAAVSSCYATFERDKKISEHAFDVSEKEYQAATQNLQQQNDIKTIDPKTEGSD